MKKITKRFSIEGFSIKLCVLPIWMALGFSSCGSDKPASGSAVYSNGAISERSASDLNAPASGGFTLQIVNADSVNHLASAGSTMVLQNGSAVTVSKLINRLDDTCFIERHPSADLVKVGEQIRFSGNQLRDEGSKLKLLSPKLDISCVRMDGTRDTWTLLELQKILHGHVVLINWPLSRLI